MQALDVVLALLNKKLSEIKSAVAAGGRYDKMIGNFVGSGREYPAVGISFRLDIIRDILGVMSESASKTAATAYVIPIKVGAEVKKIADQLRKSGINTDIDMNNRDIKKNMEYASAAGIPYAVLVGERELKEGKVTVRNMANGTEERVTPAEAANIIKKK